MMLNLRLDANPINTAVPCAIDRAAGRAGSRGPGAGVSWPSLGGEVTGGSHHGQPQVPVPGHAPHALTGGNSCKGAIFSIQVNLFDGHLYVGKIY